MQTLLLVAFLVTGAGGQPPSLIRVAPFEDTRLGGVRLVKDGVDLDLGFFAEEAPTFFAGCALCLDELVRVKGLRIAGLSLGVVGIVVMLGGLIVGLAADLIVPLLPIALLAGAVIAVGGVLFNQLAETFLVRAVNLYNLQAFDAGFRTQGFSPPGNSKP